MRRPEYSAFRHRAGWFLGKPRDRDLKQTDPGCKLIFFAARSEVTQACDRREATNAYLVIHVCLCRRFWIMEIRAIAQLQAPRERERPNAQPLQKTRKTQRMSHPKTLLIHVSTDCWER